PSSWREIGAKPSISQCQIGEQSTDHCSLKRCSESFAVLAATSDIVSRCSSVLWNSYELAPRSKVNTTACFSTGTSAVVTRSPSSKGMRALTAPSAFQPSPPTRSTTVDTLQVFSKLSLRCTRSQPDKF